MGKGIKDIEGVMGTELTTMVPKNKGGKRKEKWEKV